MPYSPENTENDQVTNLLSTVLSLAAFEFDTKARIMGESEDLDALAAAINMLGEELRSKVIQFNDRENILREIHHRVKNNLQVVSSILRLQESVVKDAAIAEKFKDCQARVNSMALVHSQLYTAATLNELEVNAYFSELCMRLHESYRTGAVQLHFCGLSRALYLNSDQMIPLGLIASELVINAYNHGFSMRSEGSIRLELLREGDELFLSIEDTGAGFSDPKLFYDSQSLGLQLVHSLIEQLDARLVTFVPDNPCRVEVAVPV